MTEVETTIALAASGLAAGVMNALAGGGTILTFPTLLLLGMSSLRANATSTVALVPGAIASAFVHRREVREHAIWLRSLLLPSIVGGAAGSALLLVTPEQLFAGLAPFLVLFATVLFAIQIVLAARGRTSSDSATPATRLRLAALFQLLVGIYGGYFGAGIGILMLAVLGFLGIADMHAMNGLKNVLGAGINLVACIAFIAADRVDWGPALTMMVGATLGGFVGAKLTRFIGREKARVAVVLVGVLVTAILLARR